MVTARREQPDQAGHGPSWSPYPVVGERDMVRGDRRTSSRAGWLDLVRDAADLALLGILAAIGALGVVTAGAAAATASAAIHHWLEHGHWPTARDTVRRYGRELLPGVPVTLLAGAVVALLALNVAALDAGAVPGGRAFVAATVVIGAVLAGYAAWTVVEVGGDGGWRAAARRAARGALDRPGTLAAMAGVVVLAALLAVTVIPVVVPILGGYLLLALYAIARRPAFARHA